MKITSAANGCLLAVSFLAAVFMAGCATAPPVNWSSRVGHYTYAQAINDLGPPNRELRLSSGETEFKWFIQPGGHIGSGAGMNHNGMNHNGMNPGPGPGPNFNPGFNNRYLQLTFDAHGVLTGWSKNY